MAQLNANSIALTALAILDERGFAGFSLRAVARALDVTPMALYHHIECKAELAKLIVNLVADELPLAPPVGDWQEDLWAMASWTRTSTLAHPAIIDLRRTYESWTPAIVARAERWMNSWRESGLDRERAVQAALASSAAILGMVVAEATLYSEYKPPTNVDFASAPNAELLLTADNDSETMFELGVRSIIQGLHARLS